MENSENKPNSPATEAEQKETKQGSCCATSGCGCEVKKGCPCWVVTSVVVVVVALALLMGK